MLTKIKEWFVNNLFKNKRNLIFSCAFVALAIALTAITGSAFASFSNYKPYFFGKEEGNSNVTRVEKFSDYSPSLEGTVGDADIYVLEGSEPGPKVLILGGTHPNEPSGQITATLLLENLKVNKGTVYIITETNRSAFTHSYPQEGSPFYYTIETASGALRTFKFGSRATNTNEQWPNPDIYVHEYSGQKLSTTETRNLNRAYPGVEDGTYTERVAYAVKELVLQNDINITIDLHEASPEYLTINAIVCHQRSRKVADKFILKLSDTFTEYAEEMEDLSYSEASTRDIHAEDSPTNLHGLTHRELGDYTNTLAFLCETSNAAQGKYRGAFTENLISYGEDDPNYKGDKFYEKSTKLDGGLANGCLYARPVSLTERVARHAQSIYSIIEQYNKSYDDISLYDNTDVATCKNNDEATLNSEEKINSWYNKVITAGEFDIDWSNLYDSSSYSSLYGNVREVKIGSFLHDPN